MSWLNYSIQVINEILQDSNIPWEQKLCCIDKAYPFGERKYHPYKQWLKARKLAKLAIQRKFTNLLDVSSNLAGKYDKVCHGCGEQFQVKKKMGKNSPRLCVNCAILV